LIETGDFTELKDEGELGMDGEKVKEAKDAVKEEGKITAESDLKDNVDHHHDSTELKDDGGMGTDGKKDMDAGKKDGKATAEPELDGDEDDSTEPEDDGEMGTDGKKEKEEKTDGKSTLYRNLTFN
jgi:hypothetical protein